ncbi:MAG: LytTR family transcriptional regulator DNA-binding domain-containing protein, partial [Clostridia bacterium]
YEVNAMQYLVKPYGYARFESVMRKVDEQIKKSDCYIDLKKKNDVVRILLSNIEYVDYDNHYIQIHTKHEMITSYLVKFCEIQDTLLRYKNFIWAYRNVIVNMDKVAKIEKKNFILLSGEAVPINSEKFADIKEKYHDYIFEKIERGE